MIAGVGRLRPASMAPPLGAQGHAGRQFADGSTTRPMNRIARAAVGADETVTIVIPTLGDWIGRTTVVDCLRGPGLAELEGQVVAFVARAAP